MGRRFSAQVAVCVLGRQAMLTLWRILVLCSLGRPVPGWWSRQPSEPVDDSEAREFPDGTQNRWRVKGYKQQWLSNLTGLQNATFYQWNTTSWTSWSPQVGHLEGWFWAGLDMVVGTVGWLVFGKSWTQVRTGVSILMRLSIAVSICVVIHCIFALCWPLVSLMVGIVVTMIWLVRTVLKCFGRGFYYFQKYTGGVPEAVGAKFFGPETGETPETADLRKLKKGSDGDRWIVLRRDGQHLVFKVADTSSIKSAGLYVTPELDTLRGDEALLQAVQGHDQFHLCRHSACREEDQHFKQYASVPAFNAEKFQLTSAASNAQQAGATLCNWFGRGASKAVQKARDMASESETEVVRCDAAKIYWEDEGGRRQLSVNHCTARDCTEVSLLDEDVPAGSVTCNMCPKHAQTYHKDRFQLKCGIAHCSKLGCLQDGGLRLCAEHQGVLSGQGRRASRSRSRSRARDEPEDEIEDEQPPPRESSLRRRARTRKPSVAMDVDEAQDLLREARQEEPQKEITQSRKRMPESSPGRTPKSGVQRSLARLGLVNSPDRREEQSTLEEFMEQLIDANSKLDLDEEDVRIQLASRYGLSLAEYTKMLYEQATEEQRKGTKGLTKFLAKWRKQVAAASTPSRRSDSWSVVGTPPEETMTPKDEARAREESRGRKESKPVALPPPAKALAVLGPPTIYSEGDRKAGTGTEPTGDNQFAEIAKAIQQQTSELATLVKVQNESSNVPAGTVRALNRTSEELVYLLRACGQYTVEVGAGEHGQGLAQALLSAQAGASTRLREAGFRQKVTPRLAVGISGPYWGTQEKFSLSAADFVAYTDAELDQHAVESRAGKPMSDQRPPMPTRWEEWQARVRRQNDVWALCYGKEWKAVREHALNTLSTWHVQAPHRWPMQVVADIWEELHWRFFEELKGELRKIKALSGRETMSLQDLKFYALMPDEHGQPPLSLPRTFDLELPTGWFMTEVMPRINRKQERLLWKITWEGTNKGRATGQAAGGEDQRAGGDDKLTVRTLLGPKLTPEESNRAKDRAPTNKDGKLLCWGYISHLGCSQSTCQRAHEHLRGTFESLDPAVRMQLLRRGGLKRMKLETKETATEKIRELRSQVSKDKDAKVKDGQDRRRAGKEGKGNTSGPDPSEKEKVEESGRAGGVTWKAPVEMQEVDYTVEEREFAELVKGPTKEVFEDVPRTSVPNPGRGGDSAPQKAQDLLREAQKLAEGPVLKALSEASDDLYAWASTRVAQDPSLTLTQLMEEMTQYGIGELAEEAAGVLEKNGEVKAGGTQRCLIGDFQWDSPDQPGRAPVTLDGEIWALYDYKEEVQMTEELAGLMGIIEPEVERRQCVGSARYPSSDAGG